MSKKTILKILHTESSCGWGGQEIRILTESEGMLARGHQVHIACPKESNIYKQAIKRGIPTTALPIARKNIKGLFALHKWLKQNSFDVINTHSSTDSWLVALSNSFFKHPISIVRTRHISAPIPKNKSSNWLYTKAADFIVTTGEKLKQTLITENNFPKEKIMSVPTGIDPNIFFPLDKAIARTQLGLPQDVFTIGILATLRSWKGHQYLIEALQRINKDNINLIIIGDGPMKSNIEKQITKNGLKDQIKLVGNKENVVPWLQSLDLFVLPSYANEGVPQSLMQAMLCELPVISTPVGSINELIKHKETGLLVKPKDSDQLAEAIKIMIDKPSLRTELKKRGRAHVLAHYTFEHMIDSMEKVFMSCQ